MDTFYGLYCEIKNWVKSLEEVRKKQLGLREKNIEDYIFQPDIQDRFEWQFKNKA